jgi:hypothetical protein
VGMSGIHSADMPLLLLLLLRLPSASVMITSAYVPCVLVCNFSESYLLPFGHRGPAE